MFVLASRPERVCDGRSVGFTGDRGLTGRDGDARIGGGGPLAAGANAFEQFRFGDQAEIAGVLPPFFVGAAQPL